MKFDSKTYRLTDAGKFGTIALVIGVIGLALSIVGYFVDTAQFYHSYLTAFVYWLLIGLGGLFFSMLHHLVGAKWSVVIRRFTENLAMIVPFMIIFFIPIIFGLHDLYHWSHSDVVADDALLQGKSGYLNVPFFIIRAVVYFLIWFTICRILCGASLQQDRGHSEVLAGRMRIVSAPGTILFALTITFASFDWLMSLDAHWYSTIFGVYIFSGALLAMLSFITFVILRLKSRGILEGSITGEHYHDLGKLIFAFTIFWGYMAFSQYFLIWYGNIPEETIWFLHRWTGTWKTVSLILVFGHFIIPFFILFPQTPKRNPTLLKIITIWILIMHWVDIYWIVMPNLHQHGLHLSWMDLTAMMGIGGIFLWLFWKRMTANPIVPVGDPNLESSIKFISN
ncbi:MAG: hypothetical protein CVT49_10020 [candidate division Zixibacteria bacterium HGW-Zixibacteria-1]|nr:MAG: hypothetical protein CVT49_10020 [candidate division Zixibacteria bacterium HGW-Zixibacteria-1]